MWLFLFTRNTVHTLYICACARTHPAPRSRSTRSPKARRLRPTRYPCLGPGAQGSSRLLWVPILLGGTLACAQPMTKGELNGQS